MFIYDSLLGGVRRIIWGLGWVVDGVLALGIYGGPVSGPGNLRFGKLGGRWRTSDGDIWEPGTRGPNGPFRKTEGQMAYERRRYMGPMFKGRERSVAENGRADGALVVGIYGARNKGRERPVLENGGSMAYV